MYVKDTILTLKKQREPDAETGEAFPYNRVKVVGESPVSHSHTGQWTGAEAAGVILTPLSNFGGTLDEPYGKVNALYSVESIPEAETVTETKVRVVDGATSQAGPTPEEVFSEEAPGTPPEDGRRRGRTLVSPLEEVVNEEAVGPLGEVDTNKTPPIVPEPVIPSPLTPDESPPIAPDPAEDEDPPETVQPSPLDE